MLEAPGVLQDVAADRAAHLQRLARCGFERFIERGEIVLDDRVILELEQRDICTDLEPPVLARDRPQFIDALEVDDR